MDASVLPNQPIMIVPPPGQRRRTTVAFRFLLVIPHLLVSILVMIIAMALGIAGWFSALFIGRLPDPIGRTIASCLRYISRVQSYAFLLTDVYPPFTAEGEHPINFLVRPGSLNRWAVAFRLVLAIPALIVNSFAGNAAMVISIASWFAIVFTGRTSPALFKAGAATIRFENRVASYMLLVTSSYPSGLLGDRPAELASMTPPPTAPEDEGLALAPPVGSGEQEGSDPQYAETFRLPRRAKAWIICAGIAGMIGSTAAGALLPPPPSFVALEARYETHIDRVERDLARLDRCLSLECSTAANAALAAEVRSFLADIELIDFPEGTEAFVRPMVAAGVRLAEALDALANAASEAAYEETLGARDLDALGIAFDERIENLGNYILGVP